MSKEKTEQFDSAAYEKRVESMSHRQLVGELNTVSKRHHEGKGFSMHGYNFADLNFKKGRRSTGPTTSLLDTALAAIFKVTLENTKIEGLSKRQTGQGRMSHYLR